MQTTLRLLGAALFMTVIMVVPASAATVDGATLGVAWALPFAGMLLSIALGPLVFPHVWHARYGTIAAFWGFSCLVPMALLVGPSVTLQALIHVFLLEYLPFIALLFALFSVSGGIVVKGNLHGSPMLNTGILAFGTVMASIVGTTGASMILVRPLLRANDNRRYNVHVFVFFIFLVSNIGGSLTPLGDPPLFLGFLRGVDFFWTTTAIWRETLIASLFLLGLFFAMDSYLYRKEGASPPLPDPSPDSRIRFRGLINLPLLLLVIGAILLSGSWEPGYSFRVYGVDWPLQNVVREVVMIFAGVLSVAITPREHRKSNEFDWGPIVEVAKLFAAIFICIIPVMAMLQAGDRGVFAPLVALVTGPDGQPRSLAYFWLTGSLSAVLDNAPTYLVFFELAGGDPVKLMGPLADTLTAISAGAVFMGAMTYIGNAPNFMVYAIARSGGVNMPTFFGYIAWSGAILLPLFAVLGYVFFR